MGARVLRQEDMGSRLLKKRIPMSCCTPTPVVLFLLPLSTSYSDANLLTSQDERLSRHDLFAVQVWRVAHPPVRGHRLCGTQPLVHKGFLKCWQAGGFNHKVIKRIMELVRLRKPGADKLKIYVTGAVQIHRPCETCFCLSSPLAMLLLP